MKDLKKISSVLLKADENFNFKPNQPLRLERFFLEEKHSKNFSIFLMEIEKEFGKKLFSGSRIGSLNDGYQFIAQEMLGHPDLIESEVLVQEDKENFFFVSGKRKEGVTYISHSKKNINSNFVKWTSGPFTENILLKTEKYITYPEVVYLTPNIKMELEINGSSFAIDFDGEFWEKTRDVWVFGVSPCMSVRRYLQGEILTGVLSQSIYNNKVFSLLENGLLFDGAKICPKNTLSKKEYQYLVKLAEVSFSHWKEVRTGDSYDCSLEYNIHKDLTPCLYWE